MQVFVKDIIISTSKLRFIYFFLYIIDNIFYLFSLKNSLLHTLIFRKTTDKRDDLKQAYEKSYEEADPNDDG